MGLGGETTILDMKVGRTFGDSWTVDQGREDRKSRGGSGEDLVETSLVLDVHDLP